MAKKQATQPEQASDPTPAEQAKMQAAMIVELESRKADLEKQIKSLKEDLVQYVEKTGEKDLGYLVAEQRQGKPKIDFGDLTPKQKKFVLENLNTALPDFMVTTTELDVEKIYFALPSNVTVQNALKANNVTIVQEASWAFKKVGVTA